MHKGWPLPELADLRIRRLDEGDTAQAARWDAFVLQCPDATFFHRSGWQTIIREVFRHETHFLYAESGGQIVGVLPLARSEEHTSELQSQR